MNFFGLCPKSFLIDSLQSFSIFFPCFAVTKPEPPAHISAIDTPITEVETSSFVSFVILISGGLSTDCFIKSTSISVVPSD